MSKKSFFSKKPKVEAPKERTMEEIKSEYAVVRAQVAEEHLKMKAAEHQRDQATQRMAALHNEYTAAQEKAKAAAPETITKPVDQPA